MTFVAVRWPDGITTHHESLLVRDGNGFRVWLVQHLAHGEGVLPKVVAPAVAATPKKPRKKKRHAPRRKR